MFRLFFVLCLGLWGCGVSRVTVSNTLDFARLEEVVEVPAGLGNVVCCGGEELPSQVTWDGKLIFQPRLGAGETKVFEVRHGNPGDYARRTYGRAFPERMDDFAWENDRVAFRIYGPALKAVDGPSNGLDIWYKRTPEMVLERWYADDLAGRRSYHSDHGEGLDDYKVGRTLGAGAMSPLVDGKLALGENYERAELLESGPLRTTFRLHYAGGETRTISLDAGSRLTRIVQAYAAENAPEMVAAGFPRWAEATSANDWALVDEPPTTQTKDIWLGLILDGKVSATSPYEHFLVTCPYKAPITYYTGYGWGKTGITRNDFNTYLHQFSLSLKNPLVIKIK